MKHEYLKNIYISRIQRQNLNSKTKTALKEWGRQTRWNT